MNEDKNELEALRQSLELATAREDVPADDLDPKTASLRAAWLAFGQLLETALPPAATSTNRLKPLPMAQLRQRVLSAVALLAASLLIAVAFAWTLHATIASRRPGLSDSVKNARRGTPLPTRHDPTQWDDSLDDRFAQVGWQMLSIRQNRLFSTDAIGIVEYQVDQLTRAIQSDSP